MRFSSSIIVALAVAVVAACGGRPDNTPVDATAGDTEDVSTSPPGVLTANPSACTVDGSGLCASTIMWTATDPTVNVIIFVAEDDAAPQPFACNAGTFSAYAPWIQGGHGYVFTAYRAADCTPTTPDGLASLGSVSVNGLVPAAAGSLVVTPNLCVVGNNGLCAATLTWTSTVPGSTVAIFLAEDGAAPRPFACNAGTFSANAPWIEAGHDYVFTAYGATTCASAVAGGTALGSVLVTGLQITPQRIGSTSVSYMNPEFTPDGKYMVWFEPASTTPTADGRLYGTMWHCAVDLDTGALNPADGRGFSAFPSTIWTRANTGEDASGQMYVGQYASTDTSDANNDHLVVVHPTGPTTGQVVVLSSSVANSQRRSIFPTALADRPLTQQYVWWIHNDVGYSPTSAENVTLEYISLSDPSVEHTITTQQAPGAKWSPLDTTYVRLVESTAILTLGVPASTGIEVATFDLDDPSAGLTQVTSDGLYKLDPWSFTDGDTWYLLPGISGTDSSALYASSDFRAPFSQVETITPVSSESQIPDGERCLPQSHQTFNLRSSLYSAFQISDCTNGKDYQANPGEIWMTEVIGTGAPGKPIRISPDGKAVNNEPEPINGNGKAWVFYTSYPTGASSPYTEIFELWRVAVH